MLSEPIDKFVKIYNDEYLNKIETERKDTEPKVIQSIENMDTIHNERLAQSTVNKTFDKKEPNKHKIRKMSSQQDQDGLAEKWTDYVISRTPLHWSSWNIYIISLNVSVINRKQSLQSNRHIYFSTSLTCQHRDKTINSSINN